MKNENQTELKDVSVIEVALAKENITKQVIEKLKSDYLGLTINGLDDKLGFNAVENARKECKQVRVLASKICKKGREEAIQIQKDWISKEKEVISEIEIVESYLEKQSNIIKELEKQILFEAAQKSKLPSRIEKLASIGISISDEELLKINDDQFGSLYNEFYEKHLEAKAELLRIENERIAAEKAEQDRIQKEKEAKEQKIKNEAIERENAKLKAEAEAREKELELERKKQAEILAEQKRKSDIEKAQIEARAKAEAEELFRKQVEEKAKQDAILKAEKEAREKIEFELKAKKDAELKAIAEEKERVEALLTASDKEKLIELGKSLLLIQFPELKSKKSNDVLNNFKNDFDRIINILRNEIKNLK